MALGGLEHHAQGDNFVVDGVAGGRLPRLRLGLFPVLAFAVRLPGFLICFGVRLGLGHAVNAIRLHLAGRDLRNGLLAKIRHQMEPDAVLVALHPFGATVSTGGRFIFLLEDLRPLGEGLACLKVAVMVPGAKLHVPVGGDVLRLGEAFLLSAFSPFLALEVGRAMPGAAFGTAVESDLIAEYSVYFHGTLIFGRFLCEARVSHF